MDVSRHLKMSAAIKKVILNAKSKYIIFLNFENFGTHFLACHVTHVFLFFSLW